MVVSEVARLADAPRIQLAIGMLTVLRHLVPSLRMVAVLAHAGGVVVVHDVLALSD